MFGQRRGALERLVGPCEAGDRTGGRPIGATGRETARCAIPPLLAAGRKAQAVVFFAWLPVGVNYNKPARGSVSLI